MNVTIERLCGLLRENDRYLILTHKHPDCDTLGSALALVRLLQSLGKTAYAVCSDKITDTQRSLMGGYGFEDKKEPYDRVITTDVASPSLLGKYECLKDDIFIKIDHHTPREDFGEYSYVKSDSASCAEIIFDICRHFESSGEYVLEKDAASYLYCGISSDTGGFIYSNTTPQTHIKAAQLIECGVPFSALDEKMHIIKSQSKIKAEGYALSHIKYDCGGKIAFLCIDLKAREELCISEEDISNVVDIPRSVDGVETAFSVKEEKDGVYRVSLRSRETDVSAIAAVFGGGGHIRAAGCTVYAESIEEARDAVIAECIKHKKIVKE